MMYSHLLTTSKTVRTLILMPIIITLAKALGWSPIAFALPAALCIDWVVGLPISGKPNVILFSTNQYSVIDNFKYGLVTCTIGLLLLVVLGSDLVPLDRPDAGVLGGRAMNRLAAFIALAAACACAHAVTISTYVTRVDVAAEGQSQAVVQLTIAEANAGPLLVPLAPSLKPAGPVRLDSAPAGVQLKSVAIADRPHLELVLPEGADKSLVVTASFPVKDVLAAPKAKAQGRRSLPDGSTLLDHTFVNTQPYTIGSYRAQIVLPEGSRVHEIREQVPKAKRTEIEPRVALDAIDGRQGAVLQLGDVAAGRPRVDVGRSDSGHPSGGAG